MSLASTGSLTGRRGASGSPISWPQDMRMKVQTIHQFSAVALLATVNPRVGDYPTTYIGPRVLREGHL